MEGQNTKRFIFLDYILVVSSNKYRGIKVGFFVDSISKMYACTFPDTRFIST